MSQWLSGASGPEGREHAITVFMRRHIAREQRLKKAKPPNPFPVPGWLVVHGIKTDKTKPGPLSPGRPKCPISPGRLNTAQQLLCLRQHAARHLVHRLPLAGRRSSPEVPRPILLLPHDAAEGEVPLKGQDGGRHLLCLTQGVGRTGGTTAGELREELREVAQWATGPLFYLRVSNVLLRTNRGQMMST